MSRYKTKITDYGYKEKISAYNHPIQYMDEAEKKEKNEFPKEPIPRRKYEDMSDFMKAKSDDRRLRYYRKKSAEWLEIALMNPDLITFVTLTFKDPVTSYDMALVKWQQFLKRLRHLYKDKELKYICTWEYQRGRSKKEGIEKGGIFHFHALMNIGFIEHSVLEKVWGNGFIWLKQISDSKEIKNTMCYIMKYCTKEISFRIKQNEDVRGQRLFFTSNNLKKPTSKLIEERMSMEDVIFNNLENMIRDGSYDIKNSQDLIINHVEYVEYKKPN